MPSDPLSSFFHKMNRHLRDMGADFEIGAEVRVPATIRFGEGALVHETTLDVTITENGWNIKDPDVQVRRIQDEIRDRFTGDPSDE